jgi:hypothetical protein
MKESHIIAGVIIGTVVVIGGGVLIAGKANQASQIGQTAEAKAAISSATHSWGDIPINDGNVEATFAITNEGTSPLQLFNVSTSCMCTTAQLEVDGRKSPEFGMHTKARYVTEVPAGGTAQLRVVFDPAFHGPQGVGAITRQVKLQTNDASQPELMVTLNGTVI